VSNDYGAKNIQNTIVTNKSDPTERRTNTRQTIMLLLFDKKWYKGNDGWKIHLGAYFNEDC